MARTARVSTRMAAIGGRGVIEDGTDEPASRLAVQGQGWVLTGNLLEQKDPRTSSPAANSFQGNIPQFVGAAILKGPKLFSYSSGQKHLFPSLAFYCCHITAGWRRVSF